MNPETKCICKGERYFCACVCVCGGGGWGGAGVVILSISLARESSPGLDSGIPKMHKFPLGDVYTADKQALGVKERNSREVCNHRRNCLKNSSP